MNNFLFFVLFIFIIFILVNKNKENMNYSESRNHTNASGELYDGNFVKSENIFLPEGIIPEGSAIPSKSKDTYWYYGYPNPPAPPGTINPRSGFAWKIIPANSSNLICNSNTFNNSDPMPGKHKFCFKLPQNKIGQIENNFASVSPNGNVTKSIYSYKMEK